MDLLFFTAYTGVIINLSDSVMMRSEYKNSNFCIITGVC